MGVERPGPLFLFPPGPTFVLVYGSERARRHPLWIALLLYLSWLRPGEVPPSLLVSPAKEQRRDAGFASPPQTPLPSPGRPGLSPPNWSSSSTTRRLTRQACRSQGAGSQLASAVFVRFAPSLHMFFLVCFDSFAFNSAAEKCHRTFRKEKIQEIESRIGALQIA